MDKKKISITVLCIVFLLFAVVAGTWILKSTQAAQREREEIAREKINLRRAATGEDKERLRRAVAQALPGESGYQVAYGSFELYLILPIGHLKNQRYFLSWIYWDLLFGVLPFLQICVGIVRTMRKSDWDLASALLVSSNLVHMEERYGFYQKRGPCYRGGNCGRHLGIGDQEKEKVKRQG